MTRPPSWIAVVFVLASTAPLAAADDAAPAAGMPAAAAPAAPADAAAEPATQPDVVRYADDKLTVHTAGMPLTAVLDAIATQAGGAKVAGTAGAGEVAGDFENVPLKEGLERLLGNQNFTLTYTEAGTLKAIELKGTPQDAAAAAAAAPKGALPSSSAQDELFKAFDHRGMVPVDGPMAKRLGRSEAPWDLLTNQSIGDDDPAVRRSGVRAGVHAMEADEGMRQAIVEATGRMSDAELAGFARARLYHRAEDFVRNVMRETSLPDFRQRAAAVLRELHKIPFEGPIPTEGSAEQQSGG